MLLLALSACDEGRSGVAVPTATTIPPSDWDDLAEQAFAPLTSSAFELPAVARRWLGGDLDDAEFRSKLESALDDATTTRDRVRALPPAPAKELYVVAGELHVQHLRIHLASMEFARGPQREQVALLARRVRTLGDRVFDRGRRIVDPGFGGHQPGVQINLPEDVPNWVAEGMAVGPPFEVEPGPAAPTPLLREQSRPTQPEADWLAAVRDAAAPTTVDFDGDLAAQARAYVAAAEALRGTPDPDIPGGRERSATLRLRWLIKADAARAAQAGLLDIAHAIDRIEIGT